MRGTAIAVFLVFGAGMAEAHVTVLPRESHVGAAERYTVRVPTEGQVATTSVELEIPPDVTVTEVVAEGGFTHEVERDGDRIISITWTKDIKPRERAEFVFLARNPSTGTEIAWKAHQRYADGTSSDWVGPVGDRRPASVTKLVEP